jgi:hypothetical protein
VSVEEIARLIVQSRFAAVDWEERGLVFKVVDALCHPSAHHNLDRELLHNVVGRMWFHVFVGMFVGMGSDQPLGSIDG